MAELRRCDPSGRFHALFMHAFQASAVDWGFHAMHVVGRGGCVWTLDRLVELARQGAKLVRVIEGAPVTAVTGAYSPDRIHFLEVRVMDRRSRRLVFFCLGLHEWGRRNALPFYAMESCLGKCRTCLCARCYTASFSSLNIISPRLLVVT